ncbi:SpoIIE family protein phosphatase [Streptomyces sp. NPDC048663]|uniref:ATP-binding SpoIIE family protein phosphatase n=1 Tax=Streptomyces sp. NPDC048663 TaxID=3155638 RepID=UPI003431BF8E
MTSDAVLLRIADDGRVVEWTRRAEVLFGRARTEAEGRTVRELLATNPGLASGLDTVSVRPVLCGAALSFEVRKDGAQRDQAVVRALFAHSPGALYVLGPDLRVLRAPEVVFPSPYADAGALDLAMVLALDDPDTEREVARRVLETGEPSLQRLVQATSGETGRPAELALSYVRVEGPDGEVLGLIASALDVTRRERALRGLQVLHAVREQVGSQLDVSSVCQELVDAVVPAFAGVVVVEVIDDVLRGEEPPLAPVSREVPLRRTAFRGPQAAHAIGDVRTLPQGTPFSRALYDLRPRLLPVTDDSPWLSADPARGHAIICSGGHSLIVAPLSVRGQALGLVSFYRHRDESPFDEDDVGLASDVCAHAALCVDNARRFTRERTIAATLKRRLLPQRPSATNTLDVAQMHIPGPGGGGAWFDVIGLAGGRTLLVLGDVVGRGVATATTMGQLRTVIHALAALDLEPDELMAQLSDTATRLAEERTRLPAGDPLSRNPLTAGCLIVVYDAVDHTCTMVRAGLPPPYLVLPGGAGAPVPAPGGPLLVGDRAPFPATVLALPVGSALAVCNESLPGSMDQVHALLREGTAGPLDELADALAYELRDRDDTEKLMLLVRARGLPAERVLTMQLDEDLLAVPAARTAAREQMARWHIGADEAFTAELIVSELVANAVRYGAPPYRLRLILDEWLTCEVRDAGTSVPRLKHARQMDEDGRGLFIVAGVADGWGIHFHPQGKTVWARQSTQGRTDG